MNRDQWEQSPPQTTLTGQWVNEGEWMKTKKIGVDDDQIELDRKKVLSDQKKKRSKDKPFSSSRSAKKAKVSVEVETDVSALTENGVSEQIETEGAEELVEDQSSSGSDNPAFINRLKSPREEAKLHSRFPSGREVHNNKSTTTIPKNDNKESRLVKDLNKHILHQNDVIAYLRTKLDVIRDISNDSTTFNSKLIKPKPKKVAESSVKLNGELISGDGNTSELCKNVINLHIH